jgi:hypothetical protein
MRQRIRFCASVGNSSRVCRLGNSGPPLAGVANWCKHLSFDWQSPVSI